MSRNSRRSRKSEDRSQSGQKPEGFLLFPAGNPGRVSQPTLRLGDLTERLARRWRSKPEDASFERGRFTQSRAFKEMDPNF